MLGQMTVPAALHAALCELAISVTPVPSVSETLQTAEVHVLCHSASEGHETAALSFSKSSSFRTTSSIVSLRALRRKWMQAGGEGPSRSTVLFRRGPAVFGKGLWTFPLEEAHSTETKLHLNEAGQVARNQHYSTVSTVP